MSAIYMSQLSTALPLLEGDHHQDHRHQVHFQAFSLPKDPPILFPFVITNSSASDSSLSYGSGDHHHVFKQQQQHQAMQEPQHMIGVSSSAAGSVFATPFPTVESIRDDMIEPSSYDPYDMGRLQLVGGSLETAAGSWTTPPPLPPPAKMRITRKASADPGGGAAKKPRRRAAQGSEDMMGTGGQPSLGVIRVCSDCNTTKTPLWRSGPCGPKSLCNACGIRQRKARRAMMASAGGGSGPAPPADGAKAATATPRDGAMAASAHHPKVKKEKRVDVDRSLPFKKRCKVAQDHTAVAAAPPPAAATAAAPPTGDEVVDAGGLSSSRDLVDDIGLLSWSRSPAPPSSAASCSFRSSPGLPVQQDEITDAAMLLMTLSCGLVRS